MNPFTREEDDLPMPGTFRYFALRVPGFASCTSEDKLSTILKEVQEITGDKVVDHLVGILLQVYDARHRFTL
tara:strand:- start:968 stop:1183 length:216 start_codon:yes stop_codon:yes gene_type:complete